MENETIDRGPGFYKKDQEILFAPNSVFNKDYELHKEQKDEYEYPIDGWCWFDSEEEAKNNLGITD